MRTNAARRRAGPHCAWIRWYARGGTGAAASYGTRTMDRSLDLITPLFYRMPFHNLCRTLCDAVSLAFYLVPAACADLGLALCSYAGSADASMDRYYTVAAATKRLALRKRVCSHATTGESARAIAYTAATNIAAAAAGCFVWRRPRPGTQQCRRRCQRRAGRTADRVSAPATATATAT